MKKLTCEMCGGTDLVKQDGVYVCQWCGTKYSVEEAKKLVIDGPVDVSGSTVKVDTSAELENLYQIARRARDDNNAENAAKYYDMILVKDPTSWEAAFYTVYFKAMGCKIAQIRSAAVSVSNCEDTVLALIRDHVPEEKQEAAVREIVNRSVEIAIMLATAAWNHYDGISSDIRAKFHQEFADNASAARDIMYICGTQIEQVFGEQSKTAKLAADAWKAGVKLHLKLIPALGDPFAVNKRVILSYAEKIGKYDSAAEREILTQILANTSTNPLGCLTGFAVFCAVAGVAAIIGAIIIREAFLAVPGIVLIGVATFFWRQANSAPSTVANKEIVAQANKRLAAIDAKASAPDGKN